MQDFQFFVTDDRYAVASMSLVQTKDEASARVLAMRMLNDRHHRAVEVWRAERRLFSLGDPALSRAPSSPAPLKPD